MSMSFEEEQVYLIETQHFIEKALEDLSQSQDAVKNKIMNRRKEMNAHEAWMLNMDDANGSDHAQDLNSLRMDERTYNQYHDKLNAYHRLLDKPYFGKVVLEDGALYIGTQTLMDSNYRVLVCDWRAPIASLFYENELGKLSYETETGRTVFEEVKGRRQFKIVKGQLIDYVDSDMFIGDTELMDYQMNMSRHKLGNIVSTIQSDQNEIIRLPMNIDVVVLGPPGSGKTAIAMQRIAYLLFKYKKKVTHENLMLLAPNRIFNDYVSDVLPELGERHIEVKSLMNIVNKITYFKSITVERKSAMITRVYRDKTAEQQFYHKSSVEFFQFMSKQLVSSTYPLYFKDVTDQTGRIVISKEDISTLYNNYRAHHDLSIAIQKLTNDLIALYQTEYKRLFAQNYAELENQNTYIGEKADIVAQSKAQTVRTLKRTKWMLQSYRFIHIEKLYQRLCRDYHLNQRLKKESMHYEDFWALVWLYTKIVRRPDNHFKHILVDEVQDYSIFQLDILRQCYPEAHFTFLGDLNQNFLSKPFIDFENFNMPIKQLTTSYRSTKAINRYLEQLKGTHTKVVSVEGNPIIEVSNATIQHIRDILKQAKHDVAIVVPSQTEGEILYHALRNDIQLKLIEEDDSFVAVGHIVIPYDLVKGFEYHTVISWRHNDYESTNIQYIIASRAISQLYLLEVST
ncbi:HelD family protein [Staphylococcus delphini]|uniref:HelD family protein n=1 Tax=Staphylococcus delphini TaxID=53344 RepID=UPI000BBCC3D9|nr:UvrD-helicase domain-containing protein [Staphylococcus delphini]MDE9798816.1 AAA family ATPase [Staphylococcus delphini]MDE9806211.1 AAA family ATPase [Staphylococcus delphini]PCF37071.1 hypothetical protein B5B99_09845 [Staphylococcus delphini]PCF58914.1 hypothetical protein B5B97_00495 [Staphylococcus delphini]PCF60162.1 hypothetical protein B5C05_05505 [Staphylococcus delphini]